MTILTLDIISGDAERPLDGEYADLNYVPWYAGAPFPSRLRYLNSMIATRKKELSEWDSQHPEIDEFQAMFSPDRRRISQKLIRLLERRRIELTDQEPLNVTCCIKWVNGEEQKNFLPHAPVSQRQLHRQHLQSQRWQRIRTRKMVSANWSCQYPGCQAEATECHHKHYGTLGFEENCDLEALCRDHHEMRHRENPWLVLGDSR
jgi:hypothetical protein